MSYRRMLRICLLSIATAVVCAPHGFAAEDDPAGARLAQEFQESIRPLVERYCSDCHAGEQAEAEIDLTAFETYADVRSAPKIWLKVREMLDSGQMPPPEAEQPTPDEREQLKAWVRAHLTREARAHAGDPGPIVLRRLTNAEYNYAARDLTGIDTLDPTREFPVDGAAGEGFTNTGAGQGMSPSLVTKYLDAAKEVAGHAVLLPDGMRFSEHTTRRDQTDELLARIRSFYARFTDEGGGSAVDLQGIRFETNRGGRLPVEKYLAATLAERQAPAGGGKSIEAVARERNLNARYLETLWTTLTAESSERPSMWLDDLRAKWQAAEPAAAPALAAEIAAWQEALWKFNSVGHVGRVGGPTSWMEPVSPVTARHEVRFKLPAPNDRGETTIFLAAADVGDGSDRDHVVWENPRIEFPPEASHPPIPLRDVRGLVQQVEKAIAAELGRTQRYLEAVVELRSAAASVEQVARARNLNPRLLTRWRELAGLDTAARREITGHFKEKQIRVHGYDAINGWGKPGLPNLLTNRAEEPISFLTLTVPARGVTVHPSPAEESVVAWRSPIEGAVRIEGRVGDADDKCGNGAAWRLEIVSVSGAAVAGQGEFDNGGEAPIQPADVFDIRQGDIVSLAVGPRDENHACDTTHVELTITEDGGRRRVWNLAADVVDNVLAGNPLPDAYGHRETWHFCAGGQYETESRIPPGSALAQWRAAVMSDKPPEEIARLAAAVERVLTSDDASLTEADRRLRAMLSDWKGPLRWLQVVEAAPLDAGSGFGIDPARFGEHPDGPPLDAQHLCIRAPAVIEVRLPASLASGGEFVATAALHPKSGGDASVQVHMLTEKPAATTLLPAAPVLVHSGSDAERRVKAAMAEFRDLFPPALCYTRIVPVDEVVTLTLFHREDEPLQRRMLDESQRAELDRLWDELRFVSREPIALTVVLEQLIEFATQDRPDLVKAFEPLREPVGRRADEFQQRMLHAEPSHLVAVLEFADRAWRRPLTDAEQEGIRALYNTLRETEIPHDEAIRLCLARVLTSPAFLYRREEPAPGPAPAPVSDLELATRLSYFLWSSLPDAELRRAAQEGRLTDDRELLAQTRRMLRDERTRRLAVQFACQWLHIRDFDQNAEKNEKLYPEFASLRDEMYEESVRFFEDMFRGDGSILDLLNADHTFLNETLARHYSIGGVEGPDWRRVEGMQAEGRGGVLPMATFLASQSGASRTSPILRGNWVFETLLGERLPRPPADVPQLPDAPLSGLSTRELIERHSSTAACARCHARIDPYGFALEQYDAIGRRRPTPADTRATLPDGKSIEGLDGLRNYLATDRRDDVVRQFCRKLLGYALGREVQLSDEPLLAEIEDKLAAEGYRFHVAVEAIVTSRQFRDIRGQEMTNNGE